MSSGTVSAVFWLKGGWAQNVFLKKSLLLLSHQEFEELSRCVSFSTCPLFERRSGTKIVAAPLLHREPSAPVFGLHRVTSQVFRISDTPPQFFHRRLAFSRRNGLRFRINLGLANTLASVGGIWGQNQESKPPAITTCPSLWTDYVLACLIFQIYFFVPLFTNSFLRGRLRVSEFR